MWPCNLKIQDVMDWLGYSKCIKCVQYVYFTDLVQIKVTCSAGPNSVGLGSNFVCALPHFYSWVPYMPKNIGQKKRNWVIWINSMGTTWSDQFQKLGKSQILWTCNFFHTFDTNKRIVAINYGYSADKIPKVLPKTFNPYFQRRLVFTDIHS